MNKNEKRLLFIVDDDQDDQLLAQETFKELGLKDIDIKFMGDGQQLVDYLRREGAYSGKENLPVPSLILLDLNMPLMDGRQVLLELKADRELRNIPVVILTTSLSNDDFQHCTAIGANGFYNKPNSYNDMIRIFKEIYSNWLAPAVDGKHARIYMPATQSLPSTGD
jgi:two-component system, response regulator